MPTPPMVLSSTASASRAQEAVESVGIGAPELIRAAPGPYKVKPTDPGGLDVAGESGTAFETSAGQDSDAQLDLNALAEQPVARPPKEEPKKDDDGFQTVSSGRGSTATRGVWRPSRGRA